GGPACRHGRAHSRATGCAVEAVGHCGQAEVAAWAFPAHRHEGDDEGRIRRNGRAATSELLSRPNEMHCCRQRTNIIMVKIQESASLMVERTASAWPGTLTLRQTRMTRPSSSIRTVVRTTPMKVFPYNDFSAHTP